MRFVKLLRQYGLIALLGGALSACAGLSPAPKGAATAAPVEASGAKSAAQTAPANAAATAATAATSGSASTGAAVAPSNADVAPPLAPDVLRAFDASLRAMQQGRLAEAERGFVALTRSNPELGGPHANLGILYRRAGKIAQAISELEFAVRDSPRQPVYWNQLGITYRQQGQFAKARQAYERALALDPNYASANLNLGILFDLYLWDSKRALELYDRYLALAGGDEKVSKWVTDLKNRNRDRTAVARKEQE